MKEGMAVLGALAVIVIIFTVVGGGTIGLGTSPTGPQFHFGFSGPTYRGSNVG